MRRLINGTFVVLMGLSLPIVGCATSSRIPTNRGGGDEGGSTGEGGSKGEGGAGGSSCVAEVCDGVDNNCDGTIDEGCDCLTGDTQPCYTGPQGTENVGLCKGGARSCDPVSHTFGMCEGEVVPAAAEACDGKDEDCNGAVDDGLPDLTCGVGACMATAPACDGGQPGTCVPGQPGQEICDGVDNDCDQLVDEAFPENGMACDTGVPGVCAAGTSLCTAGVLTCKQSAAISSEKCDSLDNDCDGAVDDNIPGTGGACSTGLSGVCASGTIGCQGGAIDCYPDVSPSPELCDGLDNNCDGVTDENNPQGGAACDTGQPGACMQGTQSCSAGALVCMPNAQAQAELCDGLDNNCNGQADEGNPGGGAACTCGGTSVCSGAKLLCQGCTKEVDCNNGVDDEGDGSVDCADSQCALGCNVNVAACPAGQRLLVLSSTDVPKGIPDPGTATSTMTFAEVATVKRAVLQVSVTHTYDSDLTITLKSPSNTSVGVSLNNGSGGDNYTNTIFNDACATSILAGTAPFNGCYSPEQALSAFVNQPLKGAWTLTVVDGTLFDSGTLTAWTLAMCVQ